LPYSSETVPCSTFAAAASSLPSPSRSPSATATGDGNAIDTGSVNPDPALRRITKRLLKAKHATTMSSRPSPFRSPTASPVVPSLMPESDDTVGSAIGSANAPVPNP